VSPVYCPFCPPAVPRSTFDAVPGCRALVNLKPILPGHSLIVPRRHVERLLDMDEAEVAALAGFARRISALLVDAFSATGIDWTLQDGAVAGQTVMHLHLHLIPRWEGDLPRPGDWYPALRAVREGSSEARPPLDDDALDIIVRRLRSAAAGDPP
jgi:bis(5'-adenosyl)-triphosphatase